MSPLRFKPPQLENCYTMTKLDKAKLNVCFWGVLFLFAIIPTSHISQLPIYERIPATIIGFAFMFFSLRALWLVLKFGPES
jgi:hypothetical protein